MMMMMIMMVMMMMMMIMVMIIIAVITMIMIKITMAIMITITITNSEDSERRCLISKFPGESPSDPWSFVMTCFLGIYVGMQTARAESNNSDNEY